MQRMAKLLFLFSSLVFLLNSSAWAGQPFRSMPRILAPGHVKGTINSIQRHKGIGYHSSGYHYQNPGCLPHDDWNPYQNLKHLRTEINPETKGQTSPSDVIREGKSFVVPFRFESR